MPKFYFKNLDGLRFFSFFLVFISHSFDSVEYKDTDTIWFKDLFFTLFNLGDMGVSFFFVLSGFLITYLLIQEKNLFNTIGIKKFYIRRALRIWPLYYVVMIFGYFIMPILKSNFQLPPDQTPNPYFCFTFLNNFERLSNNNISSIISIFWSVAVEEQFYILWPILFYICKSKYYLILIGSIILFSNTYRFIYYNSIDINTHTIGVINDMGVGGLLAYLSFIIKNFFLS